MSDLAPLLARNHTSNRRWNLVGIVCLVILGSFFTLLGALGDRSVPSVSDRIIVIGIGVALYASSLLFPFFNRRAAARYQRIDAAAGAGEIVWAFEMVYGRGLGRFWQLTICTRGGERLRISGRSRRLQDELRAELQRIAPSAWLPFTHARLKAFRADPASVATAA